MQSIFLILLFVGLAYGAPAAPYIVVLGVAQDAGHPQAGCNATHCRVAFEDPSAGHSVSSLGLMDPSSGAYWVFDASPDFPTQLHTLSKRTDRPTSSLAGIFLTHAHIGHYTGLMHLGREVIGSSKVPVYAMPRMQDFLRTNGPWSQLVRLQNITLLSCHPDVQLTPSLRVEALVVPHRDEFSETVGYRVTGPQRSALYLPDIDKWERWDTAIEDVLKTVDIAYIDGTFYDGDELPGRDMADIPHPFIAETMKRLASLPASERRKIKFIHLNHTNPALNPTSPAYRLIHDRGFGVAQEGDTFEL